MKEIYLDIETTGFSTDYNEILEIAGAAVEDGKIVDTFHEYIKPKARIPEKITGLTGITNGMVGGARSEQAVLMDFIEWVYIAAPDRLIGHNIKAFDNRFINARAAKFKLSALPSAELYDTLPVARRLVKMGKISTPNCQQSTLAAYFGIEYQAHSAIEDVKALIQLTKCMQELEKPATREGLGF